MIDPNSEKILWLFLNFLIISISIWFFLFRGRNKQKQRQKGKRYFHHKNSLADTDPTNVGNEMSDIFLSYKREDRPRAKIIAEVLEQYGYSVWWDRVIPPGKAFDQIIEEAIDSTKCVIVLWSNESVTSDWVKNEAREGVRRHILVPILIDDVKIPFEFRHIQAAQLTDWQGALPNPEFDLLLKSVGQILGKPAVTRMEDEMQLINEINISETRYGEKKLPSEIAPIWRWGSLIVSLAIIIFFGLFAYRNRFYMVNTGIYITLIIFLYPTIVYLMYKERKDKIKYGPLWFLAVIVLWISGAIFFESPQTEMLIFLFFYILALVIDIAYVYKTR